MKNELMQKVGDLLELAGLDDQVIKSVTEKLTEEKVELLPEEEEKVEDIKESSCPVKKEVEDDEEEKKAPVDKELQEAKECDKKEDDKEDDEVPADDEEGDEVTEALHTLLYLVREAYEQTAQMKADFDALKEEYAMLVAERIIAEAELEAEEEKGNEEDEAEAKKHVKQEKEAEAQKAEEEADKDKAEGKEAEAEKHEEQAAKDKAEAKKDEAKEEKDYEEAHESLVETADKIAEDVAAISEAVEAPQTVRKSRAYSAFSNISESVNEGAETKSTRKAFTLFPNL